ncbi:hypothetical protein KJA15_04495, partial [Patescibacteria group bacterium]|nr:hypothetical protein [Patescibacteria group bacterium]
MKNKKTASISLRILKSEKEKLQDEANARGLLLSDIIREIITERVDGSSYDKNLMSEKQDIGLPKEPCPFCGIVVDWSFVKNSESSSSENGKYCPNPDCRELVYFYSKKEGWQKQESKSKETKELDDLLEAVVVSEDEKKGKKESQKPQPEKSKKESQKQKPKKS